MGLILICDQPAPSPHGPQSDATKENGLEQNKMRCDASGSELKVMHTMRISDSSRNNYESCWGGTVEAEKTNAVACGREVSGRSKDERDRGGRFALGDREGKIVRVEYETDYSREGKRREESRRSRNATQHLYDTIRFSHGLLLQIAAICRKLKNALLQLRPLLQLLVRRHIDCCKLQPATCNFPGW